jgi:hypothetical protein
MSIVLYIYIYIYIYAHIHTCLFACILQRSVYFLCFLCPVLYKVQFKVDFVWRKATVKLETLEPKEREFPVDLDVSKSVTINIIRRVLDRNGSDK